MPFPLFLQLQMGPFYEISLISLYEEFWRGNYWEPTPQGEEKVTADRRQTSDCHPA